MAINIDNIIGSASIIQSRREKDNTVRGADVSKPRDSVEIGRKVNTRLDAIDSDLKNIQSSLSKNQTVRDGLNLLLEEISAGGSHSDRIIKETMYSGEPVLSAMLKDTELTPENIRNFIKQTDENISAETVKLTKLQIETENIFASNMAGGEQIEKVIRSTETLFVAGGTVSASNRLSALNADLVMRLIR